MFQGIYLSPNQYVFPHIIAITLQLEAVGAELFRRLDPDLVVNSTRETVFSKTDDTLPDHCRIGDRPEDSFPPVLNKRIKGNFRSLEWRRMTNALSVSQLHTGDVNHECALYQIAAGGRIPEHDHNGTEMTVVIRGGFSDTRGVFHEGDFICWEKGQIHSPTALESEDCICLAVSEAPLRFTGWRYRWMNPFIGFNVG